MNADIVSIALKMLIGLSVVLATFWGALILVKKFSNKNSWLKSKIKNKPVEVLSYQGLGPNKGVYLLRCCDQKLLVGVTQTNINLISEIADLDDELVGEVENKKKDFQSNLRERLPDSESENGKKDFQDKLGVIARV